MEQGSKPAEFKLKSEDAAKKHLARLAKAIASEPDKPGEAEKAEDDGAAK